MWISSMVFLVATVVIVILLNVLLPAKNAPKIYHRSIEMPVSPASATIGSGLSSTSAVFYGAKKTPKKQTKPKPKKKVKK